MTDGAMAIRRAASPARARSEQRDLLAVVAVTEVVERYRQEAERRCPGVLEGDVEDLHQFRVAIRRTRSVLGVASDVLPEDPRRRAAASLRSMARLTSPVRDLDVFIEDLPELCAQLPADDDSSSSGRGLRVMTELAVAMRERPAVSLEWALRGSDGRELWDSWAAAGSVVPTGGEEAGRLATQPAGDLVDRWVEGAYRRARKRGRAALVSDDLEHWHDLRKALKRLRYLLTAFESMYAKEDLRPVRKPLRRLQDHIGRLQDIRVQEGLTTELRSSARRAGFRSAMEVADHLDEVLRHRLAEVQAECTDAWTAYDTRDTRAAVRHLTSR